MGICKPEIERFFAEYEKRTNQALTENPFVDVDGIACSYAESFMDVNPEGVCSRRNDDSFRQQILKGYSFYRSIGARSMQIQSLDTADIDNYHSMARVCWRAYYIRRDASEASVDFYVTYFLMNISGSLKIFCHISSDNDNENENICHDEDLPMSTYN